MNGGDPIFLPENPPEIHRVTICQKGEHVVFPDENVVVA
jgi:hypothetical protein